MSTDYLAQIMDESNEAREYYKIIDQITSYAVI